MKLKKRKVENDDGGGWRTPAGRKRSLIDGAVSGGGRTSCGPKGEQNEGEYEPISNSWWFDIHARDVPYFLLTLHLPKSHNKRSLGPNLHP